MPWTGIKMGTYQKGIDALVHGKGTPTKDFKQQIQLGYDHGGRMSLLNQ